MDYFNHSDKAKTYLECVVVRNTEKNNRTLMAALSSFVLPNLFYLPLVSFDDDMKAMRRLLFPDGVDGTIQEGNKTWTLEQLKKIIYFLIEFALNYRKRTGG